MAQNIEKVNSWLGTREGMSWTLVTKVLCGHEDTMKALQLLGANSIGDSRLANIMPLQDHLINSDKWYLRIPTITELDDIVSNFDVSLNSEVATLKKINEIAKKMNKVHKVIIMIELGDLREGVLPGKLTAFYEEVFGLKHIDVLGIGSNFGCLNGSIPTIDQYMQLVLYRELLELKFNRPLPVISAGTSASIPQLLTGELPKGINHFRVGESIFLGTDLINGGHIKGLREDVFILRSEIAEVKEKSWTPLMEPGSNISPFEQPNLDIQPGQRGRRAVLTVGQLDVDVNGLTPTSDEFSIAGASSDMTVINIDDNSSPIKIGDFIDFKLNYSALVNLMHSRYITKVTTPEIDQLKGQIDKNPPYTELPIDQPMISY